MAAITKNTRKNTTTNNAMEKYSLGSLQLVLKPFINNNHEIRANGQKKIILQSSHI
jgi:hypothetical protein